MKDPAAVAFGRRGGRANTPAQQAARRRNARLGGRPPHYRVVSWSDEGSTLERRVGSQWIPLSPPYDARAQTWLRRHA